MFILTDDMRPDDLQYMPKTQELLVNKGTTFTNAFVSYAECCPSRASILRGQYAHNHKVLSNEPPDGGFDKFHSQGLESSTIATWLQSAGYSTIFMGKYLNAYPGSQDSSYVPPGWDEWHGRLGAPKYPEYTYYDYSLNENGTVIDYGNSGDDYYTDVLARKSLDYVRRVSSTQQPFFMDIAVGAPHGPATPAERHKDMFSDLTLPRPPSFNEEDVSDKPKYIEQQAALTDEDISKIEETHRNRLRTLQAVDEMVENLVSELQRQGVLDNTYIVLMSDNGWEQGEHRITHGKAYPYEESIKIPLVVRGPGVPGGKTRDELVLNTDIAPTFADITGTSAPKFVDGRSLKPLLTETTSWPVGWRSAFLLESQGLGGPRRSFSGVRTLEYKYVEYGPDIKELYNLSDDPYELENIYQTSDSELVDSLKTTLETLKSCAEESCQAAENEEAQLP